MVEVPQSYEMVRNFNNFKAFEKIGSFAHLGRKILTIWLCWYGKFFLDNAYVKAMLHGAIFLATCNAILLLRDVN